MADATITDASTSVLVGRGKLESFGVHRKMELFYFGDLITTTQLLFGTLKF